MTREVHESTTPEAAPVPEPAPISTADLTAVADLFKNVGDPTRVQIVLILAEAPRNVTAISQGTGVSQPTVSHHLVRLRLCGIAESTREGQSHVYGLTAKGALLAELVRQVDAVDPKGSRRVKCQGRSPILRAATSDRG